MSLRRQFGLITERSTEDLSEGFYNVKPAVSRRKEVEASLSDKNQHVHIWFEHYPGRWKYLGNQKPDILTVINFELSHEAEEEIARQQIEVLVRYIKHKDISAGSFEDKDMYCFVYWNNDEVIVNNDPAIYAQDPAMLQQIQQALCKEGIEFELKELERYFSLP